MSDKKDMVKAIMLKMKPAGENPPAESDDTETETESDDMPDYEVAAADMMSALKSNDRKSFAEAMRTFIKMCDD